MYCYLLLVNISLNTKLPFPPLPSPLPKDRSSHNNANMQANIPFVQLPRWSQLTPPTKKAIPSNRNRNRIPTALLARTTRVRTQQITADDNFSLDDGLAAEDDIRGTDYLAASRHFVAGVL